MKAILLSFLSLILLEALAAIVLAWRSGRIVRGFGKRSRELLPGDVKRYLDELARTVPLRRIPGTSFVTHRLEIRAGAEAPTRSVDYA